MTTINTSDDLIRIVRENPEFRDAMRRELLTRELLELPRRFAEYTKGNERRWEGNERRWEGNERRWEGNERRWEGNERRWEENERRWEENDQRWDDAYRRLDRIENDLGELKGISLEAKLYNRGISNIATLLKVRNSRRVRVAEQDDNSAAFNQAIQKAEDESVLSEQEYNRLLATDMIVQCSRRGSAQAVYVAIEATYSIANRDITQVKSSENALRKVFPGAETHSALYFVSEPAEDIGERCREQNVHLIQVDNLR